MLTRCPHCETTFRVTPEQLKARQGQVRCGACQGVFNALDFLVEEVKVAPILAMPEPLPQAVPEPEPLSVVEPDPVVEPETAPEPAVEAPASLPEPESAPASAPESPVPIEVPAEPESEPPLPDGPMAEEIDRVPAPDERPPRRWPWAVGAFAALALLVFQAMIHFRVELLVLHPESRPLLAGLCEFSGCDLPLPAKPALVGIESSDLHPGTAGRLELVALIRNRAPFAQAHPHLELTLTDVADKALARRVFAPSEYLPAGTAPDAGFAAGGEVAVKLTLEASDIPAAGYRLYVFYP